MPIGNSRFFWFLLFGVRRRDSFGVKKITFLVHCSLFPLIFRLIEYQCMYSVQHNTISSSKVGKGGFQFCQNTLILKNRSGVRTGVVSRKPAEIPTGFAIAIPHKYCTLSMSQLSDEFVCDLLIPLMLFAWLTRETDTPCSRLQCRVSLIKNRNMIHLKNEIDLSYL